MEKKLEELSKQFEEKKQEIIKKEKEIQILQQQCMELRGAYKEFKKYIEENKETKKKK